MKTPTITDENRVENPPVQGPAVVSPLDRVRALEEEIKRIEHEYRYNVQLALARVPRRIKELRKEKDLKQCKLADATGLSRSQIANIEAGRSGLTVESLLQIAIVLDTTPNGLLGIESNAQPFDAQKAANLLGEG